MAVSLHISRCWSEKGSSMDLGFIESKTYDEISVGDTARTEHVLTAEDAMAFASISGFHSVLRRTHRSRCSRGHPSHRPKHVVRLADLRPFQHEYPGPGCTLTNVSLSFHNRIHVGDRILVKVQVTAKEDATKSVTFDCEASNGAGTSNFSGTAQLIAPVENCAGPPSPCRNSL